MNARLDPGDILYDRLFDAESGRQEPMDTAVSSRQQRKRGGAAMGPDGQEGAAGLHHVLTTPLPAGTARAPQWLLTCAVTADILVVSNGPDSEDSLNEGIPLPVPSLVWWELKVA
jgi:hypothetical protein